MAFLQEKKINGITYIYLTTSVRRGSRVLKCSRFLGKKGELSPKVLQDKLKALALEADQGLVAALVRDAVQKCSPLPYPLSPDEVQKIEEMNLKYKQIRSIVQKKDWEDIQRRFVANFVFESNALEGNSLTLKNFSEIVFENRVRQAIDLREVYDAKNSYQVFSHLLVTRRELSEKFILALHRQIMKGIDDRIGYKQMPNILLGRHLELTSPQEVPQAMKALLQWYHQQRGKAYPLWLAFQFHHRFEKIHPFADGNGRVGRMLLNYILIKEGYYPIIIRKTQRARYLKAMEAADRQRYVPLIRFALEKAKETYRKFFEVYYQHLPGR